MRKTVVFSVFPTLVCGLLTGIGNNPNAQSEKEEVQRVLKQYVEALESQDVEALSRLFSQLYAREDLGVYSIFAIKITCSLQMANHVNGDHGVHRAKLIRLFECLLRAVGVAHIPINIVYVE